MERVYPSAIRWAVTDAMIGWIRCSLFFSNVIYNRFFDYLNNLFLEGLEVCETERVSQGRGSLKNRFEEL